MKSKVATFQRARRPEHKEQRREAILDAARKLAARDGVREVSLGDIAIEVDLAKSNVLRYFGTREEIFLELTIEGWREWSRDLHSRLEGRVVTGEQMATALADSIVKLPLFCNLLSQVSTNLEHNVTSDGVREFKLGVLEMIAELGMLVDAALESFNVEESVELVSATMLFATALWPASHPPPVLAELYESDPVLAGFAHFEFEPTLHRAVSTWMAGVEGLRAAGG